MEKIQGEGVEIIYPAIGTDSPFDFWREQDFTTPSFPNLFLAIGNGIKVSQDDLVKRAKDAENSVKTEFERMAECVIDEAFGGTWRKTYAEDVFKRQISDFFDVYWVVTQETDQDYGAWYDHTASSLAAIKNCRAFKQTKEFGRKCSLDGTREILHLKEDESVREAMEWWKTFAEHSPKYCRREEALCAISLTKRMGRHFLETQSEFKDGFSNNPPRFPSTSEVATAAFKEQLRCKPKVLGVYAEFVKEVKKLKDMNGKYADIPEIQPLPKISGFLQPNIDGEWLYEETWSDSYLRRYYNIDAKKETNQIRTCKQLRGELVRSLGGEPGKYYAAIALDADNMGERIREAKDQEDHKKWSDLLIQYTGDARQIVERDYLGKLTYAGGDDLLALANLKDLLPMLKELQEKFPDFTSASAGVCIAHNKMPLGDVLQQARRMEKAAKNEGGRDALGIVLFKHSGNISQVLTKWKHRDLDVLTISEELVKLLRDDEVSKRFLYGFREIFAKLIKDEDDFIALGRSLIQTEFRRIMERAHSTKGTQSEVSQQTIDSLVQLIHYIRPFPNFLGYLEIVNFVARGQK
jgi:CRISPR-associated protein Cmr2